MSLCTCTSGVCVTEVDYGSVRSVVDILQAEYQLFKSALYGGPLCGVTTLSRQHLLDEFICLQQRHAALVASLLRSHAELQQVHSFIAQLTPSF